MNIKTDIKPYALRGGSRALVGGSRSQWGFTLIELMIAMTLGLLLVLGVINLFMANSRANKLTEGLAMVQENARTGLEMMMRDIREAGSTPCGGAASTTTTQGIVAESILSGGQSVPNRWWASTRNPLLVLKPGDPLPSPVTLPPFTPPDGATPGAIRADNPLVMLVRNGDRVGVISSHTSGVLSYNLGSTTPPTFSTGDLAMACNFATASSFRVGAVVAGVSVAVAATGSGDDQNILPDLAVSYRGGAVAALEPVVWYIGENRRTSVSPGTWNQRSLYRAIYRAGAWASEEIVPGVEHMRVRVRRQGETAYTVINSATAAPFAPMWDAAGTPLATAMAAWGDVVSVEVTLDLASANGNLVDDAGTARPLRRSVTQVVSIRSRAQ
ncbi:MAG: prepilin-type N-terminal cleavage/methylation domain-containing protein [Pseudomonadota bacterium]